MAANLPGIFFLIGVLLVGIGILAYVQQRARIRRSLRAEGVVTGLVRVRAEGEYVVVRSEAGKEIQGKARYRPEVEFQIATGQRIRFVARISTRPARYQAGDRVQVLYDPDHAGQAQINNRLDLWFQTVMLLFFGVFFAAMGALGMLMSAP